MALTMRATGLGSGIDKDRPDYTVYCGEWNVGRIYETRGDALGPRGDSRRGQGAVSEELGRLEGVGEVGGGGLKQKWRPLFKRRTLVTVTHSLHLTSDCRAGVIAN